MSDFGPLSLHVPEPAVRPGGTPDFSDIVIPRAGDEHRFLRPPSEAGQIHLIHFNDFLRPEEGGERHFRSA